MAGELGEQGHLSVANMWRFAGLLVVFFLRALPAAQAEHAAMLFPVEGKPAIAQLQACTPQGDWKFDVDGVPTTLQTADFIRWGNPSSSLSGPVLFLTDGSILIADESFARLQIEKDEVTFDSKSLGESIKIPLAQVEGIVLQPEANAQQRDLWMNQIRDQQRGRDLILMQNEDRREGTLSKLGELELQLQTAAGETLRISRKNIKAMAFQPALLERPQPPARFLLIQLADGSSLRAVSWKGEAGQVEVVTSAHRTFAIDLEKSADRPNLVGLLPIGFDWLFISDMEAAGYQHQPYLSVEWPYYRNRNVLGERIQTDGKLYEKGIGMHPESVLTYRLNQPFVRLDGLAGIDDSSRERGSVIFQVEVDRGDAKWHTAFTSHLLRGGQQATPFAIDLKGVQAIRLKVLHAVEFDTLDRANWIDVRLIR